MIYSHAATALLGAVLAAAGAWQVQAWHYDAREAERIEAQAELRRNQEKAVGMASTGFELDRSRNEARRQAAAEVLERIVERPVYMQQCLDDDGLRELNAQIRRASDPSQPGRQLP